MSRLGSLLGGGAPSFDGYDAFVPDHLPAPTDRLADHDVLTGRRHCAFHRLTRDLFEERTVYDATFGYNLARLNLDARHPDAGYRYAEDRDDPSVLWAEFTPTTPFCPQSRALCVGSFRAWNGLTERHEYDLVRVRVAPMHHRSDAIDDRLRELETAYRELGVLKGDAGWEARSGEETGDGPAPAPAATGETATAPVTDDRSDTDVPGPSPPF